MLEVGNAPLSWGVFEGDDPNNPPWAVVLDEIVAAGYSRTELGPIGFLPEDPSTLRGNLDRRGLKLTAGFVYEHLYDPEHRDRTLANTRRVARTLAELGGQYLVIIDRMIPSRQRTAGRSDRAARLSDRGWAYLVETIAAVASIATADFGLRPVLHPHCGGHIEFEDEIDRALSDLPSDVLGLCIDTGHAAVVGLQAKELVERYPSRVEYFHLKDVDPVALGRLRESSLTFDDSLAEGLFCPLGDGIVDFEGLRDSLGRIAFTGCATVEQDPDPRITDFSGLATARASIQFLRNIGLANEIGVSPHARRG